MATIKQRIKALKMMNTAMEQIDDEELYYDMAKVAIDSKTVVVSFNYRLNLEGFLNLNFLDKNFDKSNGLFDQMAALKFIRNNIHRFGGDADNVTVFGQKLDAASRRIERLKGIDEQGKPVTEELNEDDLKSLADVAGRHSASSAKSAPSATRRRPAQNPEQSETLLPKEPDPRPEGPSRSTPRRKERSSGDFFGSTEPPF